MSASSKDNQAPVGVIGSGNFGTAIANILAENGPVLLFTRRPEVRDHIIEKRENRGQEVHGEVNPVTDIKELASQCPLIFPIVPSGYFREMMKELSTYLSPQHFLIHGTKGLDVMGGRDSLIDNPTSETYALENYERQQNRHGIRTMSEVIREESVVARVGCLSGPNLSGEISQKKPAAAVVASPFQEVIEAGKAALMGSRFRVYGSEDLMGVELAGILKNIVAIGCGALEGFQMGENARALLISRGLTEMARLGKAMGAKPQAFFGLAGVGDLVATCSSPLSRNFQVGFKLASGETLKQIMEGRDQVAEGVFTVRVAHVLSRQYDVRVPLVDALYQVLFQEKDINQVVQELMQRPYVPDIDFF